jgi:hypothetical protein
MSAVFIVLAHRDPPQVARLAARLAPHQVLLHIDARVAAPLLRQFQALLAPMANVRFLARQRSGWASWGLVAAALEGLRMACAAPGWSHVMLLSGQDYPLLDVAEIDAFLGNYAGQAFLPHWFLPSPLWGADGGMARVRYWHLPVLGRRVFVPLARRLPGGLVPVGGSMYWCLHRAGAHEVLKFIEQRPEAVAFFRHVWIPDELFVPTVLMNSARRDDVINEALTYIRWSQPGSAHPDELTVADAATLIDAGLNGSATGGQARRKLFARKITAARGGALMDFLDRAAE